MVEYCDNNERAQFSVGSVEGVPFTACTSGPDIIILASNFSRVQQISAGSQISSLDCSTDVGKIAAAYDDKMVIFEPIPLVPQQQQQQQQQQSQPLDQQQQQQQQQQLQQQQQQPTQTQQLQQPPAGIVSKLDYKWIQTATIEAETPITVMSFNLEGTRLIAGGQALQLWAVEGKSKTNWQCVWRYKTATNIYYLKYSPDGTMFCSAGKSDRLVKIWYENNFTVSTVPPPPQPPPASVAITTTTTTTTAVAANTANTIQNSINTSSNTTNNNSPGSANYNGTNSTSNPVNKTFIHNSVPNPSQQPYPFIYVAHPQPVTGLEWRRTNKYTPRGAVANILITSCRDNIARVWVQTLTPSVIKATLHFHLAAVIEADCDENVDTFGSSEHTSEEEDSAPQFVVHWVNNKEIHITRSIELLLHDMLIRILRRNNTNPATSSTNSPKSHGGSCSESENDTDELDYANDDTITAESSKKLWHKLCRKMNKQRALAASGRRDPGDLDANFQSNNRAAQIYSNANNNGRASPTSLVEEFDKTLESLLKKWQMSDDLLFSINKSDGTLTLWQVKYLDGEDTGVYRQVQIDRLSCLKSALPHYDATTMSLNVTAYSPSAYLDVKRAYLAVTSSSGLGSNTGSDYIGANQLSPVDVPEILSINTDSASSFNPSNKLVEGESVCEMKDNASNVTDAEPSIFIVTQHLSGILGLWKFNFETNYPKIQSVCLVTRITGLPIDPLWLRDGTLLVEYVDKDSLLTTKWFADESGKNSSSKSVRLSFSPSQVKSNPYNFDEIKSSLICNLPSLDEENAFKPMHDSNQHESHSEVQDSYKASQMASSINILPQYHLKQLIELLAFGKLQRVKAILNHLVNCLVLMETSHEKETDTATPARWAHRSRTLSIVAQSAPSFQSSFDIDNPSSSIQQQVVEEIELDYIEVTSIKPLPLYSLLKSDTEKPNSGDNKTSTREEFSTSYESIMRARSQVDETLDEILGQSTIETINKQRELKRLASNGPDKGSLTSFNPKKAKLLTRVLTHTHLPGLSNVEQMHLLAVADAVALFDASPEDLNDLHDGDDSSLGGAGMMATNIAIDSLDDRGLRFLTAMRQHVYLTRCLPMKQRNELKASGIGNHNLVWAFHSESQDELISLIPCVQRNKPEWSELREFGIGWWLKKLEVLRKLIEKVAQSAYQARQDPLDAALFYLAMKKKTLVCALLRRVNCDKRLLKLFEQDFNDPVNRKKALKNAYALLGLHRFEHAAAFFILAGSIWDAVEVCINNLNDIQLAMVLIRLHDNDTNIPSNLRKLLFTEVLGSKRPTTEPSAQGSNLRNSLDRRSSNSGLQYNYDPRHAHQDPFLRSLAFWKLGDYLSSVHTLLESDVGQQRHRTLVNQMSNASQRRNSDGYNNNSQGDSSQATGMLSPNGSGNVSVSASVFNFYLFLKDQPLVVKHKQQLIEENEIKKRTSPVEEEQFHCHRARSLSSGELGFDERGLSRTIKQSSTEFEVLNETTRLVDKYSDEAIAEKERRLFFATAHAYLEAGCPMLALEVLCSEDHLNLNKAQRMKFIACLHILMNELNTLASSSQTPASSSSHKFSNQFFEWLKSSVEAMKTICSYAGVYQAYKEIQDSDKQGLKGNQSSISAFSSTTEESGEDQFEEGTSGNLVMGNSMAWIRMNEPILRAMLTYCNLHSATENSLTTVRLELLGLLKRLSSPA